MKTILLTTFVLVVSTLTFAQITINEVDANTPSADMLEFVELYSPTSVSLDGHVLVFFNGSDDASYSVIDLSGNMITDGFFVIGNAATANVDIVIDDNSLQNGADAVALYEGSVADFPNDTPVTTTGLIDAVVYGTNDANDLGLILGLLSGGCQIQLDEDENGDDDNQSSARVPDGGTALCPDDFIQQTPSPGFTNVPSCFGGSIAFTDETTETTLCIDDDAVELLNYAASGTSGDASIFVITDTDDIIIDTTTDSEFDSNETPEGVCRIYNVSYNGVLDTETTAPGEDLSAIISDGDCVSVSTNYLTITRNICFPDCDGGEVSSESGMNIVVCIDDEPDELAFEHTTLATEANYWYVITDDENLLVGLVFGGTSDFNALDEGVYRIWGMSYQGDLDTETLDPGDLLFGITSSECVDISEMFITVSVQECVAVEGCGGIFFSEYQEGSANHKALEIYNPTALPVSLSDYQLVNCNGECDILGSWDFQNDILEDGIIEPGDVFVIAHPSADPSLVAEADILFEFLSNGDDFYALQRISTQEIIDVIGDDQNYEGASGWTVNGVDNGTQNHTLIRMPQFNEGNPDWSTSNLEWEVLDQDVWENLGSHTIIPCTPNTDTSVSFAPTATTANEEDGSATVSLSILNPLDEDMTVTVELIGGTATSPDDYDGSIFPLTVTFPAGITDAQTFDISIIDDMLEEGAESINLQLTSPSEGVELGSSGFTLIIVPNDIPITVMDIVDAAEINSNGAAINDGLVTELRGVVYGVNMRPNGLQFTLIDPTDGIGVFNFEGDLGYTVNEGDSIHIVGTIDQFNGLTQIAPTSIEFISSDNELVDPTIITTMGEESESQLIQVQCVQLVDPSQWTNDGGGFNVDITDGTNTFLMRVDADTNVFGAAAPEGAFTLTGIGGQFDTTSPFDEGYQILPRYMEDVPAGLFASDVSFDPDNSTNPFVSSSTENTITIEVVSLTQELEIAFMTANEADLYTWSWGGVEQIGNPAVFTIGDFDDWETGLYGPLTLTLTSDNCQSVSEEYMIDLIYFSITEQESIELSVFPNPATTELTIDSPVRGVLTVYNQMGQSVKEVELISTGQQTIVVSDLTSGVYYLELRSESTVYRAQFIKE